MELDLLPENMALEISQYLSTNDIVSMLKVNKSVHTLFKPTLVSKIFSKANALFHAVKNAHYRTVQTLIEKAPYLMFIEVDDPDRPNIRTTALKESFRVFNTLAWRIFLSAIDYTEPALRSAFQSSMHELDHIEDDPIRKAYLQFNSLYSASQQDATIDINQCWLELGKAQKQHIPIGMLREFLCSQPTYYVSGQPIKDFYTIECVQSEDLDWLSGENLLVLTEKPDSQNLAVKFDRDKLGEQYTVSRNMIPHTVVSSTSQADVMMTGRQSIRKTTFSTPNERGLASAVATPSIWKNGTGLLDYSLMLDIFWSHREAFQALRTNFDAVYCFLRRQTPSVMKPSR